MKKQLALIISCTFSIALFCSCTPTTKQKPLQNGENPKTQTAEQATEKNYAGTYIGYSWGGEAEGKTLNDATSKIQTILTLDKDANITDASMLMWSNSDGYWGTRQDGRATIKVDFSVDPKNATLDEAKTPGTSMFDIYSNSTMSLFAVSVDEQPTTALLIVDPITRYSFEFKFNKDFDFSSKISTLTLNNGTMFATKSNGKGLVVPENWEEIGDKTFLSISPFSHIFSDYGILKGITEDSSVQELLEKLGVSFENSKPLPTSEPNVIYGYTGNGGWSGNYKAIETFLIGKNANELTSLVNWNDEKLKASIDENNFFGINSDTVSGATKTVQNSYDTISGATIRMSRESNSYQRALVAAGILKEDDIIKGRY